MYVTVCFQFSRWTSLWNSDSNAYAESLGLVMKRKHFAVFDANGWSLFGPDLKIKGISDFVSESTIDSWLSLCIIWTGLETKSIAQFWIYKWKRQFRFASNNVCHGTFHMIAVLEMQEDSMKDQYGAKRDPYRPEQKKACGSEIVGEFCCTPV